MDSTNDLKGLDEVKETENVGQRATSPEGQNVLLVLASSSPRRQELVRTLGMPVEVYASEVDESYSPHLAPEDIVEELAFRKAFEVYKHYRSKEIETIIIGSDTIVVLDGEILGKPQDEKEARSMLSKLQGKSHQVYTGVACIQTKSGERTVSHRRTDVTMKPLNLLQIKKYVATKEPMDKAGAYAIQGIGSLFIEGIEGCYFNVVGLPLSLLHDMLGEFGVQVV